MDEYKNKRSKNSVDEHSSSKANYYFPSTLWAEEASGAGWAAAGGGWRGPGACPPPSSLCVPWPTWDVGVVVRPGTGLLEAQAGLQPISLKASSLNGNCGPHLWYAACVTPTPARHTTLGGRTAPGAPLQTGTDPLAGTGCDLARCLTSRSAFMSHVMRAVSSMSGMDRDEAEAPARECREAPGQRAMVTGGPHASESRHRGPVLQGTPKVHPPWQRLPEWTSLALSSVIPLAWELPPVREPRPCTPRLGADTPSASPAV